MKWWVWALLGALALLVAEAVAFVVVSYGFSTQTCTPNALYVGSTVLVTCT